MNLLTELRNGTKRLIGATWYTGQMRAAGIRVELDDVLAEMALQYVVSKRVYESMGNHSASFETYVNRSIKNRMALLAKSLKRDQAVIVDAAAPEQAHEESPWFAWELLDQIKDKDRVILKEITGPSKKVQAVMKAQRAQRNRDSLPEAIALTYGMPVREVWAATGRLRNTAKRMAGEI